MGRKSTVKTKLPDSLLRELDKLIIKDKSTLDQLHDFVAERVDDPPSRSAIDRYVQRAKATKKLLITSREMARSIAQEIGPESVEGEQGRLLVEILRTMVFDGLIDHANNPNAKFDPAVISRLTRSVRDLAQAMHLEQDFAKRIKEETRKEVEAEVKARVVRLGSAEELKKLSNEELDKKIAELTARTAQ